MKSERVTVEVLDERVTITLAEVCELCSVRKDYVLEMIEEGVVEPQDPRQLTFSGVAVVRLRRALRLQRDLRINPAGAALALDLMEEIQRLRGRLAE